MDKLEATFGTVDFFQERLHGLKSQLDFMHLQGIKVSQNFLVCHGDKLLYKYLKYQRIVSFA
jgi:hypothetical protein